MFYVKALLCLIWFLVTCTIALLIGIVRWRNPSGGYIFTWLFTKLTTPIMGIKILVRDAHRLDDSQPCIYIGNHQSNLDMMIQAICFRPNTVCIGKKELVWIPFFGALFYVTGHILINRQDRTQALQGMGEAKRFLQERKISVYMFPEGTRNKSPDKLLPFKRGAFHLAIDAQVPLVPVVSCPVKPFIDLKSRKIRPGTATIEILEPISTKGLSPADVDALIERTYSSMQESFSRQSSEVNAQFQMS